MSQQHSSIHHHLENEGEQQQQKKQQQTQIPNPNLTMVLPECEFRGRQVTRTDYDDDQRAEEENNNSSSSNDKSQRLLNCLPSLVSSQNSSEASSSTTNNDDVDQQKQLIAFSSKYQEQQTDDAKRKKDAAAGAGKEDTLAPPTTAAAAAATRRDNYGIKPSLVGLSQVENGILTKQRESSYRRQFSSSGSTTTTTTTTTTATTASSKKAMAQFEADVAAKAAAAAPPVIPPASHKNSNDSYHSSQQLPVRLNQTERDILTKKQQQQRGRSTTTSNMAKFEADISAKTRAAAAVATPASSAIVGSTPSPSSVMLQLEADVAAKAAAAPTTSAHRKRNNNNKNNNDSYHSSQSLVPLNQTERDILAKQLQQQQQHVSSTTTSSMAQFEADVAAKTRGAAVAPAAAHASSAIVGSTPSPSSAMSQLEADVTAKAAAAAAPPPPPPLHGPSASAVCQYWNQEERRMIAKLTSNSNHSHSHHDEQVQQQHQQQQQGPIQAPGAYRYVSSGSETIVERPQVDIDTSFQSWWSEDTSNSQQYYENPSRTTSTEFVATTAPVTAELVQEEEDAQIEIERLRRELDELQQQQQQEKKKRNEDNACIVHAEPLQQQQQPQRPLLISTSSKGSPASVVDGNFVNKKRPSKTEFAVDGNFVNKKRPSKTEFAEFMDDLSIYDPARQEVVLHGQEEEKWGDSNRNNKASKLLQTSSLSLHGRDHEIQVLHKCLDNTAMQKQLVMISSPASGCGKTALASSLRPTVEEERGGLFVSAKFDLFLRDRPYFAFVSACEEICARIGQVQLHHPNGFFREIQNKLKSQLSTQDIALLASKLIPGLKDILKYDPMDVGPMADHGQETKQRLHYVFGLFIKAIVNCFSPLVVQFDDLQWADAASLELMQVILSDNEIPNFLMIGLYRSNEVRQVESHPLPTMLYNLEEDCCNLEITELEIGNLDEGECCSVIMELLNLGNVSKKLVELAAICHKRTLGNVFFLISFMSMLVDEGFLQYDYKASSFSWDIEKIKSRTHSTSNLVDLMKEKIRKLPSAMQKFLSVAACLGSSFEVSKLEVIWQRLDLGDNLQSMSVQERLSMVVEEGFLEDLGFTHGWIHDKVQESAFALIPDDQAGDFKFQIGKILQEEMDGHEMQENLFLIVNLVNATIKERLDKDQQVHLATLNLQATQKAISCSAFSSAAKYASTGIHYLPADSWTNHYKLTLDLHSCAVECAELLGEHDNMKTYCDKVLAQKKCPLLDKVRVYSAMASQLCNSGQNMEAVDLLLGVLDQLGCKFPKSFMSRQIATALGLVRLKLGVNNRTTKEAAGLPLLQDPTRIETFMKLLDKLGTCSYLCGRDDIFSLVIIKITGMTLKYGVCGVSSPAFAGVGIILTGVLGDLRGGFAFANYALELEKKLKCGVSLSRTKWISGFFVLPWLQPWEEACSLLLESYSEGISSGDTESATYAIMAYMILSTMLGKPLKQIEADCSTYSKQMKELHREQAHDYTIIVWQSVLNQLGVTRDPTTLQGNAIPDLKGFVDKYHDNALMMAVMRTYQLRLFTLYGEYVNGAYLFGDHGYNWPKAAPGDPLFMDMVFTGGMASFASYRITGNRKFKKLAMKARSTVKSWVHKNNPNIFHYEALFDAELAVMKKKNRKAERYYHSAIVMATRAGFIQDAALANERCCDFMLSVLQNNESAAFHVKAAIKLYHEWGAQKKVLMLQEKYYYLLEEDSGAEPSSGAPIAYLNMAE